tara:strand:- start:868 stop:1293 length:426 start_codon:yes stop_codon:yes gene_type:complete
VNKVSSPLVLAAGGCIYNDLGEVLLVHRPKYDDWSFPKGKLDKGESLEECALREVFEETGFTCELQDFIGTVAYQDRKGRQKEVHYWQMAVKEGFFQVNSEVDDICWVAGKHALEILTYHHDRDFLSSLIKKILKSTGERF